MTHLVWWMMSEEVIKPVKVEVLVSIMKGDDVCKIAIHLPLDL